MKTLLLLPLLLLASCESPAYVQDGPFKAFFPGSLLENTDSQQFYLKRGDLVMSLSKTKKNQSAGIGQLEGLDVMGQLGKAAMKSKDLVTSTGAKSTDLQTSTAAKSLDLKTSTAAQTAQAKLTTPTAP